MGIEGAPGSAVAVAVIGAAGGGLATDAAVDVAVVVVAEAVTPAAEGFGAAAGVFTGRGCDIGVSYRICLTSG
jgi:hypothetical protein